jgi:Pyridoxamine 5'-phosphate oxidase
MSYSETIRKLIASAWDDGHVCLLGTIGENGPNISPKGSMMMFDDEHLAYWERSKRSALENLRHDGRVVVIYSNMQAQRDGALESGILRFYGRAELHEIGPVRDAIFARLNEREATHVGADQGLGVLIKIERGEDVRGKPLAR